MQKLYAAIEQYNATNREFQGEGDDFNTLVMLEKATPAQVARLEELAGPLPEELKQFYLTVGPLDNIRNSECYCMSMFKVDELIEGLAYSGDYKYKKIHSLGLADMMRFSWGNDRPEFTNGQFFTPEQLAVINQNYRCFGLYRTSDMLEAAYYMYFDQSGKFGAVRYHQDAIDVLQETFDKMQVASPASTSLEDMLCGAIEAMRQTLIEWNTDDEEEND